MRSVQKLIKLTSGHDMPIIGFGVFLAVVRPVTPISATYRSGWFCQIGRLTIRKLPAKPDETRQAVEEAIDTGYRHIDTAYMYGNETEVGQAVRNKMSEGKIKREDIFITTKLPPTYMTPERVPVALEKSLKNLDLGYIDLYLIHWPMGFLPSEDDSVAFPADEQGNYLLHDVDHLAVWQEMEKAVDSGKVRSIGVSNYNARQIQFLLDNCRIRPSNLQVECHLYMQQKDLSAFCHKNGISVTGYRSLGNLFAQSNFKSNMGNAQPQITNVLEEPALKPLMENYKKSAAQVILRYLTQREVIVIPKSVHINRMKENIDIFDFELTSDEFESLANLDRKQRIVTRPFPENARKHKDFPFNDPF